MAAQHVTRAGSSLEIALARVQPALVAWREQRRHREAIPDALWRLIVPLAQAHGVSPVAQGLRLNYTALKQRTCARDLRSPVSDPLGGFVEVPLVTPPGTAPWVIELEDGRGAKLTLRVAGGEISTALTLAQGLWRQRR
jgi:hypothetical protein